MRHHSSRSLLTAACLALALGAATGPAIAQTAKNSCVGEEACIGNTGNVAADACIGRRACSVNSGNIASSACNGLRACGNNSANIAQGSCNGEATCRQKVGNVAANSCNGGGACNNSQGSVAENACNGEEACRSHSGKIAENACNGEGATMTNRQFHVAVIRGDGIGVDVTDAALAVIEAARARVGGFTLDCQHLLAGAGYYQETGDDIEPGGEEAAGAADAILLGAIGMPSIRRPDGTEIAPHLRLRERFQLYAGVRPVKAYPNAPRRLADPRASEIDLVVLRESTEGLFYSAAVHGRPMLANDQEVQDILRITRPTTEKLHDFAFHLARKRQARGGKGKVTCVDKSNVFKSMALFRKIFDERAERFPDIEKSYNYVDAQALDLIRRPWELDVLVMENMFGDILSDLAGGLVGGMGMASCAEIGDAHGLFQPAHGTAPDIMGQDKANPLAAILSGALMLDYLADRSGLQAPADAAARIEAAVEAGFAARRLRPMEFGGDQGTRALTTELIDLIGEDAGV